MGQQSCKRFFNHPISMPKCQLLNQQLLSQFVLPDKQNYESLSVMSISYIPEAAKLSAKYTDLLIALKSMKWKFEDSFYDRHVSIQWRRLSESKSIQKITHIPLSKFCQIIKFIIKNYPDLVSSIKPVYLQKSGFAVSKLWINGNITEVIIDDYLPVDKMSYHVEPWVLLLEKSMSKVLGSYKYLQEFSAGQIFSEVTGIPHYQYEQKGQWSSGQKYQRDYEANNFKKFKQVLKCDELLFETKRFSEDSSIFGYHENYKINHISFQSLKCKASLIKMTVQEKQNISIRVIQPLQKYKQNYQNQLSCYNNLLVQCFKEKNGNFLPYGHNHQINNCIYLNSVFTNIEAGNYLFYVHPIKQDSKLNIIGYSKTNLKFIQIYNQNMINKVIFAHLKSISSSQQQHLGSEVFAHIQYNNSRFALFFSRNYAGRTLRLQIPNYVLVIEQDPKLTHQIQLNEVKDKWIIILSSNHNENVKKNCFSII